MRRHAYSKVCNSKTLGLFIRKHSSQSDYSLWPYSYHGLSIVVIIVQRGLSIVLCESGKCCSIEG